MPHDVSLLEEFGARHDILNQFWDSVDISSATIKDDVPLPFDSLSTPETRDY